MEELIPTTQRILDSYPHLSVAEKNSLWKIVLEKITVFRTPEGEFREALNKLARAGGVRFFVRQKNGKQGNTVCISCFSFCVDDEKDKLSSRRRFIQSFLSLHLYPKLPK